MSDRASAQRLATDDAYFEELTRAVFQSGAGVSAVASRWPGFRRAFSNFSVNDIADYLPDDVDRLMSDPAIVKNLRNIEATIENAGEMLMVQVEHGSFGDYLESFASLDAAAADVARRFRQIGPEAAAAFVRTVSGSVAV